MTKRIASSVIRGEIDNTVEGRTTGRLWLRGSDEPVVLDLDGDCWRDLAGHGFMFENPRAHGDEMPPLDPRQRGIIGDATARDDGPATAVSDSSGGELAEGLFYFEWFSESDGRVVIDACGFDLALGPRAWQMDEEAESAQRFANAHALRDYLRQHFNSGSEANPRNSLPDAIRNEVAIRFRGYPNAKSMIAFVMSRDDLLADDEENPQPDGSRAEPPADPKPHPVLRDAEALAMRALHLVGGYPDPEGDTEETVGSLIHALGEIASKLPPVLERRLGKSQARASLEHCLDCQREALAACSELLAGVDGDTAHENELETLRDDILDLHHKLAAIRREFRKP